MLVAVNYLLQISTFLNTIIILFLLFLWVQLYLYSLQAPLGSPHHSSQITFFACYKNNVVLKCQHNYIPSMYDLHPAPFQIPLPNLPHIGKSNGLNGHICNNLFFVQNQYSLSLLSPYFISCSLVSQSSTLMVYLCYTSLVFYEYFSINFMEFRLQVCKNALVFPLFFLI